MTYLTTEIESVGPKIAVVMGGTALEAMTGKTGITKCEGMVVSQDMIAAFHPAYVLRAPSKEVRLAQALARAFKLAGIKVKTKDYKEGGMYEYEVR
jgi:uracil-DNA glycosylase family 4